jgi:SIR2-like domain
MATKHLNRFPKPLLDDLVLGQWLPIVGAGFSRNAIIPRGKQMPLWKDLGRILGDELGRYTPAGPIDAISAYEHEYGRPKLIERLSELLLIDEARPGVAHEAFCNIQFDFVCTTNFDFLFERQYDLIPKPCTPLIDEEQLSVNLKPGAVALLKLHGDLRHPGRLVTTETDYDHFLSQYPLISTFLANLLITKTAVLLGYSLDDPDFRQVWQVIGDRLGRSRRIAYAITVGSNSTDVSRFERRGVKVINLSGAKSRYAEVLAEAFIELRDFWREKVISTSQVKEEEPLRELSLPREAQTRLSFFAVPLSLLSFYRDRVFPVVRDYGFVPVTADDVVSPGDTFLPKIDALIERTLLFIVDASSQFTLEELRLAARKVDTSRILIVAQRTSNLPNDVKEAKVIIRPDVASADPEDFLAQVRAWFAVAADRFQPGLEAEPRRLLQAREYRAAVIAAITLLEDTLRQRLDLSRTESTKTTPLRALLEQAQIKGLLGNLSVRTLLEWLRIRNEVVHSQRTVSKSIAEQIVNGVLRIVEGDV